MITRKRTDNNFGLRMTKIAQPECGNDDRQSKESRKFNLNLMLRQPGGGNHDNKKTNR
jgi:hypothetical protein